MKNTEATKKLSLIYSFPPSPPHVSYTWNDTKYQGHKDKSLAQHFPTLDTSANPSLYQKKQRGFKISKKSGSNYSFCSQYFFHKVKHRVALETCLKGVGPLFYSVPAPYILTTFVFLFWPPSCSSPFSSSPLSPYSSIPLCFISFQDQVSRQGSLGHHPEGWLQPPWRDLSPLPEHRSPHFADEGHSHDSGYRGGSLSLLDALGFEPRVQGCWLLHETAHGDNDSSKTSGICRLQTRSSGWNDGCSLVEFSNGEG